MPNGNRIKVWSNLYLDWLECKNKISNLEWALVFLDRISNHNVLLS